MARHGANVGVEYVGPNGEKEVVRVDAEDILPKEKASEIVQDIADSKEKKAKK